MSRRGGSSKERTPTLIFNTYRMTGDRLETLLSEQGVVVGRIHGDTSAVERHAVVSGIQDGSIEVAILQIDEDISRCGRLRVRLDGASPRRPGIFRFPSRRR